MAVVELVQGLRDLDSRRFRAAAMHGGSAGQAGKLARRNLAAFTSDVDAAIVNAADCGSDMSEYGPAVGRRAPETHAIQILDER